ncbi:UDP-4-amino-4,6-dideoxy-N-acetyl-beta-L-altrosamine transaminase [Amylibacter sp.]|nr:UDP-4-amino-4,6-dideoxy-N-acetyl-beta-L-altrosamine transaminase [Amylibacter sp.]
MYIPYGKQDITQEDIEHVTQVLESDFLTQGPVIPRFENMIADVTKAKFATAVNSATSALHIACLALGVRKGDCVWTVSNTFVASANCVRYCGADIDFVDINPRTYNISIENLKIKLIMAQKAGRLPKVVIPVHFSGEPCDLVAIKSLSEEFNFKIIEDASHAIGGHYNDRPIGSCKYSDITVFSFHPVKIVTSGEGGAALTNCSELDHRMKLLRSHGITRDRRKMVYPVNNSWYYEQIDLGFNYRMTDIHAALGLSQLSRLQKYVDRRHEIAKIYDQELSNSKLQLPFRHADNKSALHLYVIQVDEEKHDSIFHNLLEKNIGVNIHYIPVHTQPYYQKLGFKWGDFPNSELYYKKAISLPIFPALTLDEQKYVIDMVKLLCNE